jgi:hypothetical protein
MTSFFETGNSAQKKPFAFIWQRRLYIKNAVASNEYRQCPKFCAHFILTDYQNHVRFVYYITKIPFYKRDIDVFPILS